MSATDEHRIEAGLESLTGSPGEETVGYARSPSDALRLAVYLVLAVVLLAQVRWAEESLLGFERDLVALLDVLPASVERLLTGVGSLLALVVGIGVFVPPIVMRRYRLLGYQVVANVVAAGTVALTTEWLDRTELPAVTDEVAERAGVDIGDVLDPRALAQVVSSFVILAPFVSRRWRRAGGVGIIGLATLRLLLTAHLPADLFLSMAIGAVAGVGVLLAFGRPQMRWTSAAIRSALERSGVAVAALDATPAGGLVARLDDGGEVDVEILSPDDRAADLLYRTYRYLRFKNIGDERPFSSLRRSAEHEALLVLQARDQGVHTPRLRAIAQLGDDSMLLAFDRSGAIPLDELAAGEVTDAVLADLWSQVALLRRIRTAHRGLSPAHVLVAADGTTVLTGFAFSEVAASDDLLAADVAQALAASAIVVGADRAVGVAVDVLGVEAVGASLRLLQPHALPSSTRAAMKDHKDLLHDLQLTVQERCGIDEPEFEPLDRVSGKKLFTLGTLALATYFILPQLADVPGIIEQVEEADWAWFPAVLVMSAISYVGAAMSITGAVPDRLRAVPTLLTQVASSFASKLAPAGLGGMALNVRYLQRSGVDTPVAVSGVGLNTAGGLAMHIVLLVLFAVWAGRSAFGAISIPDPTVLLYGAGIVGLLAALALAVPTVRHQLRDRLAPLLRRSLTGLGAVFRHPTKVVLLFGGAAVVSLSYVIALYLSIQAFGGDLDFAQVGAVYFAGAAVASAAPTPGGLGALEAAVIAGLVAAGMDNTVAVPSVFMFRLATFWVPVLPGWIAFSYLQHHDHI